jgi:RNA polymerase sigma-70 factor (ECF subfamily)
MLEDAALITRWRNGDDAALETLLRRYEGDIYGYQLRMLHSVEDAQDAAQETFVRAVKGLRRRYRERGYFKRWLFSIARREGLRALRRRKSRREEAADEEISRLEDGAPPPGARIEQADEAWRVRRAVDRLPYVEKEVVLLRIYSELPFKEIARILGCPLNTALGRMHNAKKRLRTALMKGRS